MVLRWSIRSRDDLERIWHFHADHDPDRADRIIAAIRERARSQADRPHLGRPGSLPGTRECVMRDLQYVIVYLLQDDGDDVSIVRVQSTAERL